MKHLHNVHLHNVQIKLDIEPSKNYVSIDGMEIHGIKLVELIKSNMEGPLVRLEFFPGSVNQEPKEGKR